MTVIYVTYIRKDPVFFYGDVTSRIYQVIIDIRKPLLTRHVSGGVDHAHEGSGNGVGSRGGASEHVAANGGNEDEGTFVLK